MLEVVSRCRTRRASIEARDQERFRYVSAGFGTLEER